MSFPTHALSIQQPWAALIAHGHKDVENRTWRTSFRGRVLIHAGKKVDREALRELKKGFNPCSFARLPGDFRLPEGEWVGGIVGMAEIVDCVADHPSEWFCGPYGFVIRDAVPLPFMPCAGALGFFRPVLP